ncbi:protein phosphatase 2C domain-containing protein [Mycobacterium sp. M26]|uniref:PP2C family protein-serine/threonine phosphatase n=1 Tax=Mycobacterium sp. M26 TaxID=1762962 RepID=UPI0009EC9691|nr:protein phosphatase 2C domain-containing protein [Mycobacterium sp. M26]
MKARITAITHRGSVRDHNEDCVGWGGWAFTGEITRPISVVVDVVAPVVVAVCDGMGGHAGGETASRLAATLVGGLPAEPAPSEDSLRVLLQRTSDAINDAADKQPDLAGMGSTVVGLVIYPDGHVLVFNVGDSRCYRVEGRYLA